MIRSRTFENSKIGERSDARSMQMVKEPDFVNWTDVDQSAGTLPSQRDRINRDVRVEEIEVAVFLTLSMMLHGYPVRTSGGFGLIGGK